MLGGLVRIVSDDFDIRSFMGGASLVRSVNHQF